MTIYKEKKADAPIDILVVISILAAGVMVLAVGLLALQTQAATSAMQTITNFFALDSVHIWWYITRAAGLMGYLLFWLSTVWGFAVSSKIFDSFLERMFTYDFHEHLSLLSLGFVVLHVLVLLVEKVEPLSLVEILVPFASAYRPFWTGIGIIAFYLTILVTVTFYIRKWISMKTFRVIHYLSVAAYVGALFHSIYDGTDTVLTWVQWMYGGTTLVTVFFLVYWLALLWLRKSEQTPA
ncbi:MAG TPA: ferric reductase-like transmembrane domain-containing protein [Anaerolineales bacterium]|nr:ferric reductase-like transmembrane domain-containing protein [Anaerolineales bacterium]HNC07992.1 ferric reductase-like transmembrane domain-containing protein [Anaerolineales bacterium]